MVFCDAHNHLQSERLAGCLGDIVAASAAQGISRMVVNGTRPEDWPRVLQLARRYALVIPSFGLHPWFANDAPAGWREALLEHLDAVPSGVGEIGLDRWMENHDLEKQEEIFRAQLAVAADRNLPVSIHCLKCWGRLDEVLGSVPLPERGFLLHSYGGPVEMVGRFVKLGAYFSISGYFAHERKGRQRETFRQVPMDRLLVETDAPDMVPPDELIVQPCTAEDGRALNHPANLPAIHAFAAQLRGMSLDEFNGQVTANFERLFGPARGEPSPPRQAT